MLFDIVLALTIGCIAFILAREAQGGPRPAGLRGWVRARGWGLLLLPVAMAAAVMAGGAHGLIPAELGLADGEMARVSSRRGTIVLATRVSHREARGNCFIPFHFREAAANLLTIDEIDPWGKIPEFKFCAVRIEAAPEAAEAGPAGAAAPGTGQAIAQNGER